jgi:chromosome segregation ATPase
MPRGHRFLDPVSARGKFYGKKSVFWKLCEARHLSCKKFQESGTRFLWQSSDCIVKCSFTEGLPNVFQIQPFVDMRTQTKIMIVVFTLTLALGALVLMYASDDVLRRFRWYVLNDPLQLIADVTIGLRTSGGLWYGWISLSAMIMVALIIKLTMNAELRAFSNRLVEAEVAKAELETLLEDFQWKERHARAAKDVAVKDLEETVTKFMAAERQLMESQILLESQDRELTGLRSQVNALTEQSGVIVSPDLEEQRELRIELRKKTELLQAKDSTIRQVEKNLTEKVQALETQLGAKDKALRERDRELLTLNEELKIAQAAASQAKSSLAEELRKETQALQAKDSAMRDLEKNLTAKVRALNAQLVEKQQLLQNRSTELETLKSEMNGLSKQLADAASARERADNVLQQELKKKTELLHSKDVAFKELRESANANLSALENQLNDKEKVLKERDKELEILKVQLTRTGAARNQVETSLAEELRKERESLRAKDSALKELEKDWRAKLHALETQMTEKQELLQIRNTELEALKSEASLLKARMGEAALTKDRAEKALQQELKKKTELLQSKDAAFKELESNLSGRFHELENQLDEKEAALKDRMTELDALRSQLTKMGSSQQEVENLLRQQLGKAKAVLEARDATIKELEERSTQTAKTLEHQLREQEKLLSSRDGELTALRSEMGTLKTRLSKTGPAPERAEGLLQLKTANESGIKQLEESSKRVRSLESLLSEKEDLLKANGEKLERLESELKEKRKELARHEIGVWQQIEKRDLWKRRLSKFGISLKD